MNNFTANLSIGVQSLKFKLDKSCPKKPNTPIFMELSFSLEGDFLRAAESDLLMHTIDYDALSQHLINTLSQFDCCAIKDIKLTLQEKIPQFSPLISNGYFTVILHCHSTFRCSTDLL